MYSRPLTMEVVDVAEPSPALGEVLVRVETVGICGSELEGVASQSPLRVPPLIMGHEFVGRRCDTNQRVSVNPMVSCLECDLCLRGKGHLCRRRSIIGIGRAGGYGELVSVPERNCFPIPEHVDFRQAAMVEPLANAIHAWSLAIEGAGLPSRVGIIGAGALGYLCALVARDSGAGQVTVSDPHPARCAQTAELGVHATIEPLANEFDVIIDAVGSAVTRRSSVELLSPGGTAVWMGLHGQDSGVDGNALIRHEKRVLGTFCYTVDNFRTATSWCSRIPVDAPIVAPLASGAEIFTALMRAPGARVKTLLTFDRDL